METKTNSISQSKVSKSTNENQNRTKMDVAKEIYRQHKDKPRKDLMQLFMDKAKLTKYGASTYIANIRKLDKEGKL